MKKSLKFLTFAGLLLSSIICFYACGIGAATITLDYGIGTGYQHKITNYTNGESVKSLPYPHAPIGFKFDKWCYDKELKNAVSLPIGAGNYTLYARYVIDEQAYFCSTYYVGSTTLADYNFPDTGTYLFLLRDDSPSDTLTYFNITMPLGSNFACENIQILDYYGNEVEHEFAIDYSWTPKNQMPPTGIYIIKINVTTAGATNFNFQ